MQDKLIEAVAKAIFGANNPDRKLVWDRLSEDGSTKAAYWTMATAAIAAVRAHDAAAGTDTELRKAARIAGLVEAADLCAKMYHPNAEAHIRHHIASLEDVVSHDAESAPPTAKPSSKPFYANAECGKCGASLYEGCEWIDAGGKTPAKMAVCVKCFQQQPRSQIRTFFINPPIPIRSFDWVAWIDGEEEGHRGHGRTEQEAKDELCNLLAQFDAESTAQLDAEDPAEQWTVVPDDEVGFVARSRKYSWCTGHGSTQEAAIKMASETLEELRCPNCGAPDGDPGAIDTPKTAPAAEPVEDVVDPITQLAMSLQWEELYTDEYKRRVLKEAIAAALVERRTK